MCITRIFTQLKPNWLRNPKPGEARKQRLRAFLAATALVVLSSSFSIFGAELLLRFLAPQPALLFGSGLYIPDKELGFHHQPGHRGYLTNLLEYDTRVEINGIGLRGPALEERPGFSRILFLGDSFVFGQGVAADEAFPSLVGRAQIIRGRQVEVLNAGVRGYSTVQEAAWLERFGRTLAPKVVVLGVYLGNDLYDNSTPPEQRVGRFVPAPSWHTPVTQFLFRSSHLYRALRSGWQRLTPGEREARWAWLRENYGVAKSLDEPQQATARALERIRSETRKLKAELVAVLIPDRIQVEPSGLSSLSELQRAHPEWALDSDNPNRIFAQELAALGIPTVDLTPALKKGAKEGSVLYFEVDGHLNATGHRLVAETLVDHVDAALQEAASVAAPR